MNEYAGEVRRYIQNDRRNTVEKRIRVVCNDDVLLLCEPWLEDSKSWQFDGRQGAAVRRGGRGAWIITSIFIVIVCRI